MRVILFTGKGGTGKTSMSAATALTLARRGFKTIAISTDSAHSLADSFSLDPNLFDLSQGLVVNIEKNLDILQVNISYEIDRYWHEISDYIALLFATQGLDEVVAEELAIIPGMEELTALLYVNQFDKEGEYDILIIDCAPTGETLRFLGMPDALEWYMNRIFNIHRSVASVVRPIAHRVANIPLPPDEVFNNFREFYERIDGVKDILVDPEKTTVRIITNPEKMVLRETKRSYTYFCMYGLVVDQVIVNKVFPKEIKDKYFAKWHDIHKHYIGEIEKFFHPIPIVKIPLLQEEICGIDFLLKLSELLYGDDNPEKIFYSERPLQMFGSDDDMHLSIRLPFAEKEGVELYQSQEELIIRIGNFKRNIYLPRSFQKRHFKSAKWDDDRLVASFDGEMESTRYKKKSAEKANDE
ncbi:ArsA family ATPase [bacterium]|nr:ArsA family ATPase [bacterium]